MADNCNNVTNPISSNQVIEVGIKKPKCFTFSGNTLNDWLYWIASKQCEIDWTKFELSGLQSLLPVVNTNTQTEKYVIQTLIDSINALKELDSSESRETVETEHSWVASQSVQVLKKGSTVFLKGIVDGGNVANSICTLPVGYRPAYTIYIPIYHENSFATTYFIYLKITSSGVVSVAFRGTSPSITSSQAIYFDGISFFV